MIKVRSEIIDDAKDAQCDEPTDDECFKTFKDKVIAEESVAISALNQIHTVASSLGPLLCGEFLIPFLARTQETLDTPVLLALCGAWYALSKHIKEFKYFEEIFKSLEFLASQEEPDIREKAIDVIVKIAEDDKQNGTDSTNSCELKLADSLVYPMVQRLASSEWFAGATSACVLIPRIYNMVSGKNQSELRQAYQQLCETNLLIVKLATVRNLQKIFAIIDLEHAISMFWLVLKNMSIESQEDVRSHAIEACLAFARRCTPEQNLSLNYPMLKAAVEDSSWRVRNSVAILFEKVYEIFGEQEVLTHLLDSHIALLNDPNDFVKNSAIESFSKWSGTLSPQLIERYVPVLDALVRASPKEIRRNICKILAVFSMKLEKENTRHIIYPTMIYLLNDPSMGVRLCVLQNIHFICDRPDFKKGIGDKLMETIEIALEDTQWRHRLSLAEQLSKLSSHFGFEIFEKHFRDIIFVLLLDSVWKIRSTALSSLEKVCSEYGSVWTVENILPELLTIYIEPLKSKFIKEEYVPLSYSYKITIIQAFVAVAKSLCIETTLTHILPLFINATKDPIPNVRFLTANAINSLFQIYKDEDPTFFFQAKCALFKLSQDCDIDVKYFSKLALETHNELFENANNK